MAQIQIIEARKPESMGKEAVAAYCRVSTDSDDQLNSYRNQVDYYNDLIAGNEDWELADIYADMYNQRLIQFPAHGSVEKCLKQRLSADLGSLPAAHLGHPIRQDHLQQRRHPLFFRPGGRGYADGGQSQL